MFNLVSILEKSSFWQVQKKRFSFDISLKEYSSFKIGGKAEILYTPSSIKELTTAVKFFLEKDMPFSIIGGGTNILFPDKGVSGVIISFEKMNKIRIEKDGNDIYLLADSGVLMSELTEFASENGISGLESFGGLPGSVGGACFMNARCYGKSVSDIISSAQILEISSAEKLSVRDEVFNKKDWNYKKSPFQTGVQGISAAIGRKIILSAIFKLKKGDSEKIFAETQANINDRINKGHFKFPSAGSVFKNNHAFGRPSGKLIDEAGLRGLSEGGAQIAPWHGNFIINKNNASSKDVEKLIKMVQAEILKKYGFFLEPEVIFA